ncbi:MAG TPA: NAD(P)-dependent oxidoreductase [Thermoanaerobaculia bacterium]
MATLVTGANGFVGRHVVARVAGAIPLTREHADLSNELPELPRVETVSHCAAELDDPARMRAVNVDGTRRLLEWSVENGVSTFVFISTGGSAGLYAETKREAEELVRASGLHAQVLRLFFPYGAGQRPRRLVPRLIESVREGKAIAIREDGGPCLSLTYIDDVADAIVRACDARASDTRDVGGEAVSVQRIAETIGTLLSREPRFALRTDAPPDLIARPVMRGVSLEEGLRRCV